MTKIGIFYGSLTGTTADIAYRIGRKLGVADADIHDVASTAPDRIGDYNLILIGSSTWGNGELEEDWYDFIAGAEAIDLTGKKLAIFGCGDETMTDTFCSAVGELFRRFKDSGASIIGQFPADGYHFKHSEATDGDTMHGLVLDEVNHPELTDTRISAWTDLIKTAAL